VVGIKHKFMHRLLIREIAERKGISMSKLSRLSDTNYKTIQAIWNDNSRDVSLAVLIRIAYVLKVSVSDLYQVVPDE
jgi:transcriptional regulator with XRE-family HTH domain